MRGDIQRRINSAINDSVFSDYAETIWVYLKASNSKGNTYDPYREIGYTKTNQSPFPIKVHARQLRENSLILRELGLSESGAIEIVVNEQDINFFKICQQIKYNDKIYTPFIKATGKIQITKIPFGFFKIILFLRGN